MGEKRKKLKQHQLDILMQNFEENIWHRSPTQIVVEQSNERSPPHLSRIFRLLY